MYGDFIYIIYYIFINNRTSNMQSFTVRNNSFTHTSTDTDQPYLQATKNTAMMILHNRNIYIFLSMY